MAKPRNCWNRSTAFLTVEALELLT